MMKEYDDEINALLVFVSDTIGIIISAYQFTL
jgi:hypothetical protein